MRKKWFASLCRHDRNIKFAVVNEGKNANRYTGRKRAKRRKRHGRTEGSYNFFSPSINYRDTIKLRLGRLTRKN